MMRRSIFLAGASAGVLLPVRAGAQIPAAAQAPATPAPGESPIVLTTPTLALNGTLTLPAATGKRVPVVLIVSGSGPTDRDGNSPRLGIKTDAYKELAAALSARGIASVRYDKRLPQTAEGEAALRFDNYVDDAKRWVEKLNSDPRFSGVTLAGHSEGSLIGILTAQRTKMHAYVSLEGAGRPAGVILREQLSRGNPGGTVDPQIEQILQQLEAGHTVADTPAALAALFRPSVQPYLISWLPIDPAKEIAKLTLPVTIVWGTADIQVLRADYDALAAAAPKSRKVVVDGMNHVLKHVPDTSTQDAIMKGYTDPTLPIEPAVVDAVSAAAR